MSSLKGSSFGGDERRAAAMLLRKRRAKKEKEEGGGFGEGVLKLGANALGFKLGGPAGVAASNVLVGALSDGSSPTGPLDLVIDNMAKVDKYKEVYEGASNFAKSFSLGGM